MFLEIWTEFSRRLSLHSSSINILAELYQGLGAAAAERVSTR